MKNIKKIINIGKSKDKIYLSFYTRLTLNIFLFITCFILLNIFVIKAFSFDSEKVFNYRDKANLDYKVYLKENNFYEEDYLGKDMVYVANLIDRVHVDFNYEFNADINVELDFKYSVIGKLTIQDSSSKNNYYEKTYTLLDEKTSNISKTNKKNIKEEISVDYDYYNAIANSFKTNYGVDAVSKLTVYLIINKNSNSKEIELNDIDLMSIEIPLSERSVNVKMDYNEIEDISNIISTSNLLIDNIIYMVLSLILTILTLILTVKLVKLVKLLFNKKTKYDKYIKRLLTEYDRLISETSTKPNIEDIEIIKISKFQELVDIRDNLKLPIMYYSINEHQKAWFYITYNNKMYLHIVKAVDLEENKNG